jgi:dipeptidyl-peptidase-4
VKKNAIHLLCMAMILLLSTTKKVNLDRVQWFYIARMQWTNDANVLSAQVFKSPPRQSWFIIYWW